MTDEELARHAAFGPQQMGLYQAQLNEALQAIQNLNGFLSVLQYESHRRRAQLVVVPPDIRV